MGYQRKELQIIGGGFNLLPPGDKTPKTDYLLSQNFRPDREGKLVSRYGFPVRFSGIGGAGSAAHSAAVAGGIEGNLYVACATGLGDTPGSIVYNSTTTIASGLSPNRPGMVYLNGWMWIIDRLVQGRHNPTGGWQSNWIPAPPTTPITAAAGAADATGPNGVYQFYTTFELSDNSLESNPGASSVPVASTPLTLAYQDPVLKNIPVCAAAPPAGLTWIRNVYATGGELGQAYLIGTINDNTTTAMVFNATDLAANPGASLQVAWSDLSATDQGIVMPINNDPPPAAIGMVGPYFSRLIAFNTATNPSRLFWTDPDLPQYWPGAADPAIGNWVDVGEDGEPIVWCTLHTNVLMIYKERSIWRLVGDPDSGTLEQVEDGTGLVNAWAVTPADSTDYFIAPGGLRKSNLDRSTDVSGPIRPLFQDGGSNGASALNPPGCILPGSAYTTDSGQCYAAALGYGMGKLYLTYSENGASINQSNPLCVLDVASNRWSYYRAPGGVFFHGFLWNGIEMVALGGSGFPTTSMGLSVDDFRSWWTTDNSLTPIVCVYQSHYEDCGVPDSQKVWLEVVIDYQLLGDTATVYVSTDAGAEPLTAIGTIGNTGGARRSTSFTLGLNSTGAIVNKVASSPAGVTDGVLARNLSVGLQVSASGPVVINNVYLYYYEEARLATAASTLPLDLGSAKVKQCKELELDIDASGGAVGINVYSDLPGNALAVRQTPAIASATGGRGLIKFPFATTEGYLWRLALTAATSAGPFRLYAVRLLMRAMGTYIEAYEAAGGFVWDSMELTFESAITKIPRTFAIALAAVPIKRFRELSFEIETFNGDVTVNFLTDLPGNAQAVRFTGTINTGTAGRRFVRLPLPAGTNAAIEGRLCRIQLSGAAKFVLYGAAVELLPVGIYVEAYEAAGGAVYDSRQQDGGTPAVKECRELELDIETSGSVSVQLLSDISPSTWAGAVTTTGRQKMLLPLAVNAALEQFVEGRLLQLILSGTNAFRLYDARMKVRAFGQYLQASETGAGALWDTTDLDLGSQTVKQLREIELDIWAYGTYTVTVYTDLPGNAMASRAVSNQAATSGRTAVQIPLPQGSVPDNYLFGRLVRVTITSAAAFKLFGARAAARPIGVYVENYEATAGAVWDSTPADLGDPNDKIFDQVRFELDTDGVAIVTVYTDLPGESFGSRGTYALTNGATGRHWATVTLPAWTEGRSIRLVVSSSSGFRIYKAQTRWFRVGRYLTAAQPAGSDALTTLEFDFRSEREKMHKRIEVDLRADNAVTLTVITSQGDMLSTQYTTTLAAGGRNAYTVTLPPGIRGRLLRLAIAGGPARVYHLRVWSRPLNEAGAKWAWEDYPLEESDLLPKWADLPVAATPPEFAWSDLPVTPTAPEWQWAPFPVNPTPPGTAAQDPAQWIWGKVLSVEETADTWQWIDVPFEVSGQ